MDKEKEHVELVDLKQRRSRRMRLRDEILLQQEQERKQRERQEKADKIQQSANIQRFIQSSRTREWIRAVFLFVLVFLIAGGLFYWYTHPQLSEQKLLQGLAPITVSVEKRMGASAQKTLVEKDGKNWHITYSTNRGQKDFFDRTIKRKCGGEVSVKIEQRLPIKEWKLEKIRRCR